MRAGILAALLLVGAFAGCLSSSYQDHFGFTVQHAQEARAAVMGGLARRDVSMPGSEPSAQVVQTQAANVRTLEQNHRAWEPPAPWRPAHDRLGEGMRLLLASFDDAAGCLLGDAAACDAYATSDATAARALSAAANLVPR
jgi:hypothetical protein